MKYEIDSTNQVFGRLASKVAFILRGKNLVTFKPNEMPQNEVTLKNIDKIKFSGAKMEKRVYHSYSGYHGGITTRKLSDLWIKKPEEVIRHAIYKMLPKNKLRDKIIQNLKFSK